MASLPQAFASPSVLPLYRVPPTVLSRPSTLPPPPPTRAARRPLLFMAAPGPDRALWANGLGKTYDGERYLFQDVDLIVPVGAKIALLGGNGAGKSTLLNVLGGALGPDSGSVHRKKGLSMAVVSQALPVAVDGDETVLRAVMRLAAAQTTSAAVRAALRYAAAARRVETDFDDDALAALADAAAAMEAEPDAWAIDAYLQKAIDKLSLPVERRVASLSGGERQRVSLAAALVSKPDIMLLDEPTNHMSVEGVTWLEAACGEPGLTAVVISHDRSFVDAFAADIWELDGGLHRYGAGYGNFLNAKAVRAQQDRRDDANVLASYKKELAWYRKQPKARGTKSRARVEKFEALEAKVNVRQEATEVKGLATATARLGGKVLSLKNVTLRRGEKLILEDFSYEFDRGARVGLIGPNGAGKSSCLNAILGKIPVDSGVVEVGETVKFGHFDQNGLDLPLEMRVMEYITNVWSMAGGTLSGSGGGPGGDFEDKIDAQLDKLSFSAAVPSKAENINPLAKMTPVALLTQFGFTKSKQHSFINTLSGGERRRLQLMSLLLGNGNVLCLDEISNDIDLHTLSMVEEILEEFTGTLIIVSHDRMLMDRLVDTLLVIQGDGSVEVHEGKFTDYLRQKKDGEAEARVALKQAKKDGKSADAVAKPPQTKLSFKEKKEFEKLEKEIARAEKVQATLSERLTKEAETAGYSELQEWTDELTTLEKEIEKKSERWMGLAERMEASL